MFAGLRSGRGGEIAWYRTKSYSGAPRSMKMGTTRSAWRYDVGACYAIQSAMPAILRYACRRLPYRKDDSVTFR